MKDKTEKKHSLSEGLINAIAAHLRKQPWEEVNQLLSGIQNEVNNSEKRGGVKSEK